MIEQNTQNFEHKELEADMQRLSREVMEKRSQPEYKEFSNKEIIKETIRPIIKSDTKSLREENSAAIESEKDFLPDYALEFTAEKKLEVEKLIDNVLHKGLKAIQDFKENVKKGKYNAEVVDAFHDSLAGKLSDELEKRKLI